MTDSIDRRRFLGATAFTGLSVGLARHCGRGSRWRIRVPSAALKAVALCRPPGRF